MAASDLPIGSASRWARLGGLTGRVTSRLVGDRVRRALGNGDDDGGREALTRSAVDVAERLGQLKGAAMKVGQGLALAADSLELPEEVRGQLSRLHADAEPVPFPRIRTTVEAELGGSLADHYDRFEVEPLGTASLAQAHVAHLPTGQEVVVKVLHHGVDDAVAVDLAALRTLMRALPGTRGRRDEIDAAMAELEARLHEELDYHHEAANIVAFQRLWSTDPDVVVPRVHSRWSTQRVLTLDRLDGEDLNGFLATAGDAERQRAGSTLARLFLESVFVHRTLHADPHPGNYRFTADGAVQLLDFGCVKRFDEYFVAGWARIILAALDSDREAVLSAARDLGVWTGDTPEAGELLWRFCDGVVRPFSAGPMTIGGADDDIVDSAVRLSRGIWRYPELRGPRDLLFLHRTLGGIYALVRRLGATGDWGEELRRYGQYAVDYAAGRAPELP